MKITLKKTNIQEKVVNSVSEFVKAIDEEKQSEENSGNKSDFLFRGQTNDYSLKPKLCRLTPHGELIKVEKLILDEFQKQSLPFIKYQPKTKWEWLALAQHYGLPTRYLDWTYSALSALWFAVVKQEESPSPREYSVVYLFKPQIADYKRIEKYDDPFGIEYTVIYRPPQLDKRIVAQQGVFTAHLLKEDGIVVEMNRHANYKKKLLKIKIPKSKRYKIRTELNMLGVNYISQFPDLNGVSEHLEQRFFKNKDED